MERCAGDKIYDMLIIGAGPIGIESATMAKQAQMNLLVIEKGDKVAHNMSRFAHLDMFSPWCYNYSPYGIEILSSHNVFQKPDEEYETIHGYLQNYLKPLAKVQNLYIRYNTEVLSIAKSQISKTDLIDENRAKYPFRILCRDDDKEFFIYAKKVIDTSGIYENPLCFGEGRIAAINEKKYARHFYYQAVDRGEFSKEFLSKTTLMIGTTYCMAKSVIEIKKLMEEDEATKIIYVNETGLKPYITQLKNDIFSKRVEVINLANELLDSYHPQIKVIPKSSIYAVEKNQDGFEVFLNSHLENKSFSIKVDNISSNCGYEASNSLYHDLQIHECYASHAPMNHAAQMLEDTMDCRFTPYSADAKALLNPEPGFYILGSKSYGRNQGFSLYIGIGQIVEIFSMFLGVEKEKLLGQRLKEQKEIPYVKTKQKAFSSDKQSQPKHIVADKEQKYKTITENLQEIIFQTNLKQKITYLSPSWEQITGFKTKDYIGLDWQMLLAEESRQQGVNQCNAFMSNRLDGYFEEFQIPCSGECYKWVEVRASVLVDENGVAYGTIGSMVDITQRVQLIQKLQKANKKLDTLSITDGLTGIYNRRYFDEMLQKEYARAMRARSYFALVICDIDYFKPYNDTYGHQKGDEVIIKVAKNLQKNFSRQADFIARYGGEEFVALLPATDAQGVSQIVEEARKEIENLQIPHINSLASKYLTMSFGVVCGKVTTEKTPNTILSLADEALYKSKKDGRNQVTLALV